LFTTTNTNHQRFHQLFASSIRASFPRRVISASSRRAMPVPPPVASSASSSAASRQLGKLGRCPGGCLSEEQKERRLAKRQEFVEFTKASEVYKSRCGSRAVTPDPLDQTISKRRWDKLVTSWKHALTLGSTDKEQTLVKVGHPVQTTIDTQTGAVGQLGRLVNEVKDTD